MLQAPADSLEQRLLSPSETIANRYDPQQPTVLGHPAVSQQESLSSSAASASRSDVLAGDDSGVPAALLDHPRYEVEKRLGKGGMGVVYKATHRMMDRTVALKVINSTLVRRPDALERFRREVKAAARLQHRNIVTAHDAEHTDDLHFLVMEYVEGADLARVVAQHGRLPVKLSCHYMRQAALGLQHAHEQGMIHRDIKPQNLVVTKEGQLKILDFGLARFAREQLDEPETSGELPSGDELMSRTAHSLTLPGSVVGTPDYLAPEQATDSRNIDIRADIYSLGCSFYFLLTGQPPFDGHSVLGKLIQHRDATPPDIADLRDDIPGNVMDIVNRMMAKSPDDRFATPGDIASALGDVMKQLKDPATSQFVRGVADVEKKSEAPTIAGGRPTNAKAEVQQAARQAKVGLSDRVRESHVAPPVPEDVAVVNEWVPDDEFEKDQFEDGEELDSVRQPRRAKSKRGNRRRNKQLRRNIIIASATALLVATTAIGALFLGSNGENGAEDKDSLAANPPGETPRPGQKRVVIAAPSAGVWMNDLEPLKRVLTEKGHFVQVASTSTAKAINVETGKRDITVDIAITSVQANEIDALVFVGYEVGEFTSDAPTKNHVFNLIREMDKKKKCFLGGVCAGTAVLGKSGVLNSRYVAWSEFAAKQGLKRNHTDKWKDGQGIVHDNNLLTAKADVYVEEYAHKLGHMLSN